MKRKSFLTASATLAALSGTAAGAQSIPGGTHFVERKADFNEAEFARLAARPADIRQLW